MPHVSSNFHRPLLVSYLFVSILPFNLPNYSIDLLFSLSLRYTFKVFRWALYLMEDKPNKAKWLNVLLYN
jgi:hypothetical protein